MSTDRRSLLKSLGVGALGVAAASVPLEAVANSAYGDLRQVEARRAAFAAGDFEALNEARRAMIGDVHPFMDAMPPVDAHALSNPYLQAKSAVNLDDLPFVTYFPVSANGEGANESMWKTILQGRNKSANDANLAVLLHPRNVPASPDDPVATDISVQAYSAIRWDNPLELFFGGSGMAWLEVRSSEPLSWSDWYTCNAAADGTQQGQGGPAFDAASVMEDQRFARAGDILEFQLYGKPGGQEALKRENFGFFVPPESSGIRLDYELVDSQGGTLISGQWFAEPGTWKQVNDLHHATGIEAPENCSLRIKVRSTGDGEALVYGYVSKVDNLDPLKQDPATDNGSIDRAIESAHCSVNSGEVNDPAGYTIRVRGADDVTIGYVNVDWLGLGGGSTSYPVNGSEAMVDSIGQHNITTGEFTPAMSVIFNRPGFGQIGRRISGKPYTVEEALPDFPEDSYDKTANNIDTIANILGASVNAVYLGTLKHYDEETMQGILAAYVNGVASPSDGELDHVEIRKADNAVVFALTDGTNAVWGGLNHVQINRLRDVYDVAK